MILYIYTIPKAGTYFLAELMSQIGFENSGYHLELTGYLDTKAQTLSDSASTPSQAHKKGPFYKVLKRLPDNHLAFGHYAVPLGGRFPRVITLCSYRHPKETLMSEFIDFRFRRNDVEWLSKEAIHDDSQAFIEYLNRHGNVQKGIFMDMLCLAELTSNTLYTRFDSAKIFFINFKEVLKNAQEVQRIAAKLNRPISLAEAKTALANALGQETKTKAKDIKIDRDQLWSNEANQAYDQLGYDSLLSRARELGWNI